MSNTKNRIAITDIQAPESTLTEAEAQNVAGGFGVVMDPSTGKTCTEPRGRSIFDIFRHPWGSPTIPGKLNNLKF